MSIPPTDVHPPAGSARPPPEATQWRALIWRALAVLTGNTAIALVLSLTPSRAFVETWVYSQCIGLSAWACIDGGRVAVARLMWRDDHPRAQALAEGWPGWPALAVLIAVGTPLAFAIGGLAGDLLTGAERSVLGRSDARTLIFLLIVTLLGSLGMTLYFHLRGVLADRDAALARAQQAADQAQLHMLQAQLQPHMLFNTLANLRALMTQDPPRALLMLDHLNTFLRSTLATSHTLVHPLVAEFQALNNFLALMQIRMGERLQVHLDLPDTLSQLPVPSGLLQPLAENAIRHGLEPKVGGGSLRVSARQVGSSLQLSVRDTGVGMPATPGAGFGLGQVRHRLQVLFGEQARLDLQAAPDEEGGTVAIIELPMPQTQT